MPRLAFKTLGCKVNQAESNQLWQMFTPEFQAVNFNDLADVYVINSCSVTSEAESKARQLVRQAKKRNPRALLVLTGCFQPKTAAFWRSLGVDLLVPNDKKLALKAELLKILPDEKKVLAGSGRAKNRAGANIALTKTRQFLKIQDGCDQFCSYCLIPYLRTNLSSKPVKQVINEINQLVKQGVKEIVLCGINLGKYGLDLKEKPTLSSLIAKILEHTSLTRLRISSLNIQDVDDGLVDLLQNEKRLAKHLHLSLQSGSNRILKLMHRRYSAEEFLKTVSKLKQACQNIGLTTDLILGFPGETDADFQQSLKVLEQIKPLKVHLFPFSARPGTAAASFPNQISAKIKKARLQEAKLFCQQLSLSYKQLFIDKTLEVLVEENIGGRQSGFSSEYLRVVFLAEQDFKNQLVKVKIKEVKADALYGLMTVEEAVV